MDIIPEILKLPLYTEFDFFCTNNSDDVYSLRGQVVEKTQESSVIKFTFQEEDDYIHNVGDGVMKLYCNNVQDNALVEWHDKYDISFNPSIEFIINVFKKLETVNREVKFRKSKL
jgi:hypothetical protein